MTRRFGRKSLRGALGTYMWATIAWLVLLVAVLWFGPGRTPRASVTLDASSGWRSAVLSAPHLPESIELHPGEVRALPPGRYTVHVFADDGRLSERVVDVPESDGAPFVLTPTAAASAPER